jgi:hypothetical protein
MTRLYRLFLSITLVFIFSAAHASVRYTYRGNQLTWKPPVILKQLGHPCPSGCKIAGYFITQGPLAPYLNKANITPLSFSFTDGRQTINSPSPSPNTVFMITTDAYGSIVAWHVTVVRATGATGYLDTCSMPGALVPGGGWICTVFPGSYDQVAVDNSYENGNTNAPGSWVATIGPHQPVVQAVKTRL